MVKQFSDKEQSDGSIPSAPTLELPNDIKTRTRSSTVERFVYIEDVGGSNPSESTKCRGFLP